MTVDPKLLGAWRRASFEAAGVVIKIGQRSAPLDRLLADLKVAEAVFVGAWNPYGRKVPHGTNERMELRLNEYAARFPSCKGSGFGPRWREAHLFLAVPRLRGLVIARRFRQAAIVQIRRAQPARLVFVPTAKA